VNGILDITGIVGIHRAMKKALRLVGAVAWIALVLNEIRGVILAVPVLWAMYQSGGTLIALSVIVPALIARRVLA
jgi:hypothetical protein